MSAGNTDRKSPETEAAQELLKRLSKALAK